MSLEEWTCCQLLVVTAFVTDAPSPLQLLLRVAKDTRSVLPYERRRLARDTIRTGGLLLLRSRERPECTVRSALVSVSRVNVPLRVDNPHVEHLGIARHSPLCISRNRTRLVQLVAERALVAKAAAAFAEVAASGKRARWIKVVAEEGALAACRSWRTRSADGGIWRKAALLLGRCAVSVDIGRRTGLLRLETLLSWETALSGRVGGARCRDLARRQR